MLYSVTGYYIEVYGSVESSIQGYSVIKKIYEIVTDYFLYNIKMYGEGGIKYRI